MQTNQFQLKTGNILADRAHIDMPLLSAFFIIFLISGIAIFSASNGNSDFVISDFCSSVSLIVGGDKTNLSVFGE